MVMKLAVRQTRSSGLALCDESLLPGLLGMPSELVTVSFRAARVHVLASLALDGEMVRVGAPAPVTDPLHLELLSGPGEAPGWQRPATVHAVIEARTNPVLAVQSASRWASYAARVAVVPQSRLNDKVLLEAQLRGVWLVTANESGCLEVAAVGERGPAEGSVRGLPHRLLNELVWAALIARDPKAEAAATRSAISQVPSGSAARRGRR